jgi:hypothetical protein
MSKFINKLKLISQIGPQPMGFRAATAAPPKPKMLLVATLAEASIEGLADYVTGADAGLLLIPKLSSGAKAIHKISQAMSSIPWGGWLKDTSGEGIKSVVEAGCDFVVFPSDTPLATLHGNEVGKILEVGSSLSEGLLKAIDDLPVDAVLISSEPEKDNLLTWHHLMFFRRCGDLLTKPLLASVPSGVSASELQALWAAGVVGVVVDSQPQGRILELRQIIDKLTFPLPSKRGKIEPLLPHISGERETAAEEEEEEE